MIASKSRVAGRRNPRKIHRISAAQFLRMLLLMWVLGTFTALFTSPLSAQDQPAPSKGQTEPPAESGGPQGDTGPYAIPKKKEEPPPPPPPEKPKKIEGMPDYSIRVDVPLVEVPVTVTTKDGQFISNLKQENFRIFEDGVEQKVTNFNISDAPITAALLVEFGAGYANEQYLSEILTGSYAFAGTLKKDDWLAVISYDKKPYMLADFTQNKQEVYGALSQLRVPMFSDTNLFDALYDTLDRMDRIDGHKYIILISTGIDTFSKINLDEVLKKVKNTKDITIFPVSVGWQIRNYYESHGSSAPHSTTTGARDDPAVGQLAYLQADNQMNTFAHLTGGRAFFPRFQAEYSEIFHQIGGDIRNQYMLAYHPTNPKLDGSYRKLKVAVMAPDGGPLKFKDQKGKDVKVLINAREGYTAKHTVD